MGDGDEGTWQGGKWWHLGSLKAKGAAALGSLKSRVSSWGQHIRDNFARLRGSPKAKASSEVPTFTIPTSH